MLEYSRVSVAWQHIRSKCLIAFPRLLCKLERIYKYSSKVNRPNRLVAHWKSDDTTPWNAVPLTCHQVWQLLCACVYCTCVCNVYEYMCSCTQMCMGCVYTCMWCVCMYVDQRLFDSPPSYFLRLSLSLSLELTELAGVFSQELQEPPVSTSPCWDCKCASLYRPSL